jgi:CopG family transcriptional regulator, nickel-responsive regulator
VSQLDLLAEHTDPTNRADIMGTNHAMEHAGYGIASLTVSMLVGFFGFVPAFRVFAAMLFFSGLAFPIDARKKKLQWRDLEMVSRAQKRSPSRRPTSPAILDTRDYSARISMSLPRKLLEELDATTRRAGYGETSKRSKALQIAIRDFIDNSRIGVNPDAHATGTVLVLFDHTRRSVENITQFIHSFGSLVVSTLHVHLPEPYYLYVMVVRGRISDIKALERQIRNLSGINQLKVSYLTTELENDDNEKAAGTGENAGERQH